MIFALLVCLGLAFFLILGSVTVQQTYSSQSGVIRTFTGEGFGSTGNTVQLNGMNTTAGLNSTSTPAISKDACLTFALSGGAATLDLTNITDPNLGAVSLSGLTPAVLKLQCPSTNANPITVAKGATNGYTGFGSSLSITIQPGGEVTLYATGGSTVGGSSKTLDFSGTGAQVVNIQITAG